MMTQLFGEMYNVKGECPICHKTACYSDDAYSIHNDEKYTLYSCPYCGKFDWPEKPSKQLIDLLNLGKLPRYILAGYLYEQANKPSPAIYIITPEFCDSLIISGQLPTTSSDYLDKICLNLYNMGHGFMRGISTSDIVPALGYVSSEWEIHEMIQALVDMNYLYKKLIYREEKSNGVNMCSEYYYLTIDGLKHVEAILASNKSSVKAFIAMRFSDKMMKARDEGIKPACKACGFNAITVNEKEHNDDITDRIIAEIKTSRFVIADFTENNQGVYYEAGFAKGLGIPVIKTCKKAWFDAKDESGNKLNKLHFDIEHDNLMLWENEGDFREKLEARIRATIL